MFIIKAAIALLALVSLPAWAEMRTVTLTISNMVCELCVMSVQRSLAQVDGVTKVEVSLERAEATVTFDDAKTNVKALTNATRQEGFPSSVRR
ncbi:MAG TPA: mercury resistance system periplasmic binding protein MerP [Dehalococcoidia bacterium]|jgi:mercuric ion binding protein|nr:mercury resistance system periplasmic binding protein MerP [Dehalococcoidia bacterium]